MSDFPSTPALSVELWARELKGLLDALGIGRAIIMGASMGGMIALEFCYLFPDRAIAELVVCSSAKLNPRSVAFYEERASLAESVGVKEMVQRTFHTSVEAYSPSFRKAHPEKIQLFKEALEKMDRERSVAAYRAIARVDLQDRLDKIKTPTLIVAGEYDTRMPVDDSELICMRVRNSLMKIVPDSGHFIQQEQPEIFRETVVNYLQKMIP
jgi:3-oxoadipate enol-lactonase